MWFVFFFFFKQKTAYEMRISDWSSDVGSSDLLVRRGAWYGPSTGVALVAAGVGYALAAQVPDGYRAACTVLGFGLLIPALACADLGPRGSLGDRKSVV